MSGKEIADICRKHNSCKNCELRYFRGCNEMGYDMEYGSPGDIYDILEKDYGEEGGEND